MIYAFDVKMKDNYILFGKSKLCKDLFLLSFYACDNAVCLYWTVWHVEDLFTLWVDLSSVLINFIITYYKLLYPSVFYRKQWSPTKLFCYSSELTCLASSWALISLSFEDDFFKLKCWKIKPLDQHIAKKPRYLE